MQPIRPIHYKIHLKPDLVNFIFEGTCALQLNSDEPVSEIALNVLEIAIWKCRFQQGDRFFECAYLVDPGKEEVRIMLPESVSGDIHLEINYQGLINDKMAGFYRSKYVRDGETKYIAVTQFEESDARRAFPCMDHPAQKATFAIEMDIQEDLVAISNGAVKRDSPLGNGKKRVVFEQTPKMSTYLVFFGVGEFEFVHNQTDPRVRVATLPGMKEYGRFGVDFGRKALEFGETYYGINYPLPKMDLIAIPDFAFGAMENWGAITFRENLLLHYPDITSKSGEERICEVIAHEIAHQWFGNLVTPSDWKYLWLNESFATYFGFGVADHYYPKWNTWEQFLEGNTGSAMARDSLWETFAIEIPGGEHVVINASTAPIIYSKGGSILRQVEGYIGKDNFKKGLRHYLKKYAYACAASRHLWESFEHVSRLPVSTMMKSWVEQPGFPVVEALRDGDQLKLSQKRFTYLPGDSDQKWIVPVTIKLIIDGGDPQELTVLLDDVEKTIDIDHATAVYKVNNGQTGFYRVNYRDAENLSELGRRVRNKRLPSEDRWGLQNDLYAFVKRGDIPAQDYLDFLTYYENEDAYLPLTSIAHHLFDAYLILEKNLKEKIATMAVNWFETLLATIGYDPNADEENTTSILREQLIWLSSLFGSKSSAEFALKKFNQLMEGYPCHPDIMRSVMQVGALTGNRNVFDWFDRRLQASESEHERMNMLTAVGCFQAGDLIDSALEFVLDKVPARNKFIPVVAMASNPHAMPLLWEWYTGHLEQIEQFHPMLYERVIAAIIPVAGLENVDEVRAFFEDYLQKTDKARDAIKMSLERLEINLRMRNNN